MSIKNKDIIYSSASPEQVAEDLKPLFNFHQDGISSEQLSSLLKECLIPHFVLYNRPEFHSLYNFFPEEGAELGARVALQYNQGVTNWQVSPGGVMLEELCCQKLCQLFDLSQHADATFMYSGTYANQQALYMALHHYSEQKGFDFSKKGLKGFKNPHRLAVVTSIESHFSIRHALRIMGLGDESLITVPVDNNFRMDMDQLREIVKTEKGRKDIFCLVSTAGTTSTGSIDPILPMVEVCQELGAWLHVDGAYGLAFYLIPEKKPLFTGLKQADSVCWDPHKQFGVPIPNSILFSRRQEDFQRMAIFGEYFNREGDLEPNPGLKSPPSTRPLSALPLVATFRYQGIKNVIKRLQTPLITIRSLAEHLEESTDFEVCHQPDGGLLCIRVVPQGSLIEDLDQIQRVVYERIKEEGKRSISITRLGGKTVLRIVVLTPKVTLDDLLETIKVIRYIANQHVKK